MADHSDAAGQLAVGAEAAAQGRLSCLKDFKVLEVLSEDPVTKSIALLGRFTSGGPEEVAAEEGGSSGGSGGGNSNGSSGSSAPLAVLLLGRKPFDKVAIGQLVGERLRLTPDFANDIYSKYVGFPPPEHAALSVDLVFPATEKHVQKHRQQRRRMVTETPEMYEQIVLPYIQSLPPSRLQWVYNILEKKKEAERLIFEDPHPLTGFMLHPDLKWDQHQVGQLYCLALVHRRDLPSLRSLDASHLPLLRNVRHKGCKAIKERYGVPRSSLRLFVHYHPSYWHFHVHFVHAEMGSFPGAVAGKAILLDDVIDNLCSQGGDYWRRRNLTLQLGEADELWGLLGNEGSGEGEEEEGKEGGGEV
ncbi:hypothetical protein Agub_g14779, partial [Astrephomene gubernaculifera]